MIVLHLSVTNHEIMSHIRESTGKNEKPSLCVLVLKIQSDLRFEGGTGVGARRVQSYLWEARLDRVRETEPLMPTKLREGPPVHPPPCLHSPPSAPM